MLGPRLLGSAAPEVARRVAPRVAHVPMSDFHHNHHNRSLSTVPRSPAPADLM